MPQGGRKVPARCLAARCLASKVAERWRQGAFGLPLACLWLALPCQLVVGAFWLHAEVGARGPMLRLVPEAHAEVGAFWLMLRWLHNIGLGLEVPPGPSFGLEVPPGPPEGPSFGSHRQVPPGPPLGSHRQVPAAPKTWHARPGQPAPFWLMHLKRSESSRECTCVRTRPIEIAPDFRHRGTNTAFGSFSVLSGCHGCRSMPSITDTTKLCLLFDVSGTAIHLGKACRFSSRVA